MRIKLTEIVNSTADRLFFLSEDYDARLKWDPFVKSMKFLNGATKVAKGVRMVTVAYNDMAMETVFVGYLKPEVIAFEMVSKSKLFSKMAGTWKFRPISADKTEVEFIYSFSTMPKWLAPFLNQAVKFVFKRDMKKRIRALKAAAESNS